MRRFRVGLTVWALACAVGALASPASAKSNDDRGYASVANRLIEIFTQPTPETPRPMKRSTPRRRRLVQPTAHRRAQHAATVRAR